MARLFTHTILAITFALITGFSQAAMAGYSVETRNFPSIVAPDVEYFFSIRYTTPDDVESLDILLSLKHPASGYTRYFNQRDNAEGSDSGYFLLSRYTVA